MHFLLCNDMKFRMRLMHMPIKLCKHYCLWLRNYRTFRKASILRMCMNDEFHNCKINVGSKFSKQWYQQPTRCNKICFIDSFKLALRVAGDIYAHIQEHFDCIYSFLEQCTGCAVCCRPVTQIRWSSIQSVSPVGSRQHSRCIVPKSCIYSQSAPEYGRKCRPQHVEQA